MTTRARPLFTVKEYDKGQPWICIEYLSNEPGMPNDLYGFDLAVGTTYAKAQEIAKFMQDNLEHFAITKL